MKDPAFSVVTPAYNSTATIELTVRSVLAQTRADLELIVVDDGSTDGTRELVAALASKDPRVRLIGQSNQGTAGARNTGIDAARAPLVAFLDHDDLWLPGYLDGMAAALEAQPGAGFAYTSAYMFDDVREAMRRRTSFQQYAGVPPAPVVHEQLRMLIETNFVMSSTMVPAAVLAAVGGFATEIQGADDWDLWLRIVASGRPAVAAAEPLLVQREHPASQSNDLAMMFANMERVMDRVISNPTFPDDVRALARDRKREIGRKRGREGPGGLAAARRMVRDLRVWLREDLAARRTWTTDLPGPVADAFGDWSALRPRATRR